MKPLITEVAKLPRHQWRQSTLRHEVSHHRPQKGAGREPRFSTHKSLPEQLPLPKEVNVHPSNPGGENASFFFLCGNSDNDAVCAFDGAVPGKSATTDE